jgi:hypothetical protein
MSSDKFMKRPLNNKSAAFKWQAFVLTAHISSREKNRLYIFRTAFWWNGFSFFINGRLFLGFFARITINFYSVLFFIFDPLRKLAFKGCYFIKSYVYSMLNILCYAYTVQISCHGDK